MPSASYYKGNPKNGGPSKENKRLDLSPVNIGPHLFTANNLRKEPDLFLAPVYRPDVPTAVPLSLFPCLLCPCLFDEWPLDSCLEGSCLDELRLDRPFLEEPCLEGSCLVEWCLEDEGAGAGARWASTSSGLAPPPRSPPSNPPLR